MFRRTSISSRSRLAVETQRIASHSRAGIVCRRRFGARLQASPTLALAVILAAVLSVAIVTAATPSAHAAGAPTGPLAATTLATTPATAEVAALTSLTYYRGYSLQGNWLCFGWWADPADASAAPAATATPTPPTAATATDVYHCTQHWHRDRAGTYISDNRAWVPNAFLDDRNFLCLRWYAPQQAQSGRTGQLQQPPVTTQDETIVRCVLRWHRDSAGTLISDNPAWVPSAAAAAVLVLAQTDAPTATSTPTPRASASPTPSSGWIPPAQSSAQPSTAAIQSEIRQVFGSFAAQALQVAACESGFDPTAVNAIAVGNSHAVGVFQILYPSTWNTTSYHSLSPLNADDNIRAAYEIFSRDGHTWREWVCQPQPNS